MECPQTIHLVHAYFTLSLAIPVHSNFDGLTGTSVEGPRTFERVALRNGPPASNPFDQLDQQEQLFGYSG